MKIITLPIDEIRPYGRNPRLNDIAVPAVAASIREFGFRVPLLIDRDGVIIAGHTRYKAALSLGLTELPCVVADDLTPKQVRAYRLMDNKSSEKAHWNEELLEQEFQSLADMGYDLTKTAFEQFEIESIMDGFWEEDDTPEEEPSAPEASAPEAEPMPNEGFSMIICCEDEAERQAVAGILGVQGELKQAYRLSEILAMSEAREKL